MTAQSRILRLPLIGATLFVLLTPVLVALRMLQLEFAFGERAQHVLLLFAVAGCFAGFAVVLLAALLQRWLSRRACVVLAAVLMVPAVLAAGALSFTVYDRFLLGHIDEEALELHFWHAVVWSSASGVYLFATSGLRYLLPWPAPVLAATAALLVARLLQASRPPADSGAREKEIVNQPVHPVEPG